MADESNFDEEMMLLSGGNSPNADPFGLSAMKEEMPAAMATSQSAGPSVIEGPAGGPTVFANGPFADIPITLKAILGQVTMPISTLMNLKQGELLPLDKRVGEPIEIVANGNPIARGELVVADEDPAVFCVQIVEILGARKK